MLSQQAKKDTNVKQKKRRKFKGEAQYLKEKFDLEIKIYTHLGGFSIDLILYLYLLAL